MKSYASNTTDKVQEEKDAIKEMKCPVCEEKHDLDNCKQFSSMSVDERSKMLRKKDYAMVATFQCQQSILPRLARKGESAKFVQ